MKQADMDLMLKAINEARATMNENIGGPFGALIVDETGKVLAVASNTVLRDHDPTAHAEINAIRKAAKAKGSHDLSGCTIYSTCFPCPMCLGAIIWSNIKTMVYGCQKEDADAIGFRDDFIYDFIRSNMKDLDVLEMSQKYRSDCLTLFKEYQDMHKEIY